MTVTKERAAESVTQERKGNSVRTYVSVGLVSLAIGIGAVFGVVSIADSASDVSVAQQAAIDRANQIDDNLDVLVATGLAQQAAMERAAELESRIAAGQVQAEVIASAGAFNGAWRMRGAGMADNLDTLEKVGLAQQAAIDQSTVLASRVEVGLVQGAAINSASAFHSAWRTRGAGMADNLDTLEKVGLAQQAAIDGSN